MIHASEMIQELKDGVLQGINALRILAEEGVEFICGAGPGGSGKDMQFSLIEAIFNEQNPHIKHIGTSTAIRNHKNSSDALGKSLLQASDNEKKGVLFPDEPTLAAIACEVLNEYNTGWPRHFLLSGFPRGLAQPGLAMSLKGSRIMHYWVAMKTVVERAQVRTEQRLRRGLEARPDDNPLTVMDRHHDHQDTTVMALCKLGKDNPGRIKWVNGEQPIRDVLESSLEALGCASEKIKEYLKAFDERKGGIAEIMKDFDAEKPQQVSSCKYPPLEGVVLARQQRASSSRIIKIPTTFLGPKTRELPLRGAPSATRTYA